MAASFRILGPFEVLDADRAVALGGPRQRALLAVLVLRANEVVSVDRLIDELWGEAPPPTARQTIQVYVSQLRRALAAGEMPEPMIETRAPGYVLHLEPGRLDLDRFEELFAAGRTALAAGMVEEAASTLREALALWRGPPLADFAYEEFAQREIARLAERRLACVEERIEADLALGRHADLVGELEGLVAEHPVRERLRGQLMIALYGAGRQAEALECYAAGRRALADELGIEPSGALRELERRMLTHDPTLLPAAPPAPPPLPADARHTPQARWRLDRRLIVAGGALLAVAVGVGLWLGLGGGDGTTEIPGDSVVSIDAGGGRASAPVAVGASPSHLAVSGEAVWVGGASDHSVRRIDPETDAVVDTIPLGGGGPDGLVAADGSVWATNAFDGTVARITPETNTIVQTIRVPTGPRGIAHGEGAVWVASLYARTLTRIDSRSGDVVARHRIGGSPLGVAVAGGAVWVTNESDRSVSRVDPRSGRVIHRIGVGNAPGAIAAGAGSVWVANTLDATVSRIDPATNAVTATIGVGEGPAALAADDRAVWVADELAGTLTRIDPRSNAVAETIATGQRPAGLALDDGRLWLAARDASATHRGGTLRVAVDSLGETIDQFDYSVLWDLNLTGDGLTAYRRTAGAQGATLVPNLAVSIPVPVEDGRTYTFQLRRGVRYSNGQSVGPDDLRRAIERYFRLGSAPVPFYDVIVGAPACRARPSQCDLSRGIVADRAAHTVTIHLTRPDPNLFHYLALPFASAVAPGAPQAEVTTEGLPATGPYVVASRLAGKELRLVRNPHFREWSGAARPDGYPDEIVLTVADERESIAGVEEDRFDLALTNLLDPAVSERLAVRYPGRLRTDPINATFMVALNTTRAPFDSRDARRAVAFALDREELVRSLGGTLQAQTTCQVLPPNFPSYEPYCPFTSDPRGAGGPDLDDARTLLARSGTTGATIVVRAIPSFAPQARYVADALRGLGYRATFRLTSDEKWLDDAYGTDGPGVQVGLTGWVIDYAAPSSYFAQLRCGSGDPSRFCDEEIDRQMDEALALQATDPAAADRMWAQIDRALTDEAVWVTYATPKVARFLGQRAGNYQGHAVWSALLDQVWVR